MKLRSMHSLGVALIAMVMVTSCHPGLKIRIFNNTSAYITATASWHPRDFKRKNLFQWNMATFDWPSSLSVSCGSNHWSYAFPNLPTSYLERKTFAFYLYVQVQADGTLFAMPNGARHVVTNFPSQPPGFPLKPSKSG